MNNKSIADGPPGIDKPAMIHWSLDGWGTASDIELRETGLGCWFADLPSHQLQSGDSIAFTFHWQDDWQGHNFQVAIVGSQQIGETT